MSKAFRESLASLRFELPTLEECEAAYRAGWPAKAGLTAEGSLGMETLPTKETGLTVPGVEDSSAKSAWCPAPLLKLAALARAVPTPLGRSGGRRLAEIPLARCTAFGPRICWL